MLVRMLDAAIFLSDLIKSQQKGAYDLAAFMVKKIPFTQVSVRVRVVTH